MSVIISSLLMLGFMNAKAQDRAVEQVLSKEIAQSRTPSIQYLIFNQDRVINQNNLGVSNVETNKKVDEETTFNFFSISKTFTALAILQLTEKNQLNINHSVKKYLPDFPYSSEITIKQLLSHSAGIPNPIPLSWTHLKEEHQAFKRDNFFKTIFQKHNKAKAGPNEKYAYSNLGYVLLGQVIEKVSGLTYEAYIETNIIEKLNLTGELGFEIKPNHAVGYHKQWTFSNFVLGFLIDKSKYMDQSKGTWKPFKENYVNGPSYGGLIGTPSALMVYMQELLKPNNALISEDFKSLLFMENKTNNNKPTGMCLSWFKGELKGNEYFTHAGGGGGYYCEIRIYPKLGIGSIIVLNRTGMKDERFLDKLDLHYIKDN